MAFMLVNREGYKGPYPCYEGEFCGNYNPEHSAGLAVLERMLGGASFVRERYKLLPSKGLKADWWDGQVLMEGDDGSIDLNFYRLGRPRACEAGTSAEMAAQGFSGLYLRRDVKPFPDDYEPVDGPLEYVPTPDSLREPPELSTQSAERSRQSALAALLFMIAALLAIIAALLAFLG